MFPRAWLMLPSESGGRAVGAARVTLLVRHLYQPRARIRTELTTSVGKKRTKYVRPSFILRLGLAAGMYHRDIPTCE